MSEMALSPHDIMNTAKEEEKGGGGEAHTKNPVNIYIYI
jgi:hypothetical protein